MEEENDKFRHDSSDATELRHLKADYMKMKDNYAVVCVERFDLKEKLEDPEKAKNTASEKFYSLTTKNEALKTQKQRIEKEITQKSEVMAGLRNQIVKDFDLVAELKGKLVDHIKELDALKLRGEEVCASYVDMVFGFGGLTGGPSSKASNKDLLEWLKFKVGELPS